MRVVGCMWVALLLSGCVDELSEKDSPCPCASGWYCDNSGGKPGVCRKAPAPLCAGQVTSFIDPFDDQHLDDWQVQQGDVKLSGERLLALRTAADNRGLVIRPIEPGPEAFSVELDVELYSDQSFAEVVLTRAGAPGGYTVVLCNSNEQGYRQGLFLVPHPSAHAVEGHVILASKTFVPPKGRVYRVRLEWRGGSFELFLDGESVGQATDHGLSEIDRLQLGAGQATAAGHGAYFDNLVIRSCGLKVPTFAASEGPLWEGAPFITASLVDDGGRYRLYHAGNDDVELSTSADGKTWTDAAAPVIGETLTGEKYNRYASFLLEGGAYHAWLSATSGDCVEYTKVFHLTSSDGDSWTLAGEVLTHGAPNEYDSRNIDVSSVVHDGTTYHLYYNTLATSGGDQCDGTNNPKWQVGLGYATSTDGATWTKRGVVIHRGLDGDPDGKNVSYPHVIQTSGGFEMYYSGSDGENSAVMYATSPDGLRWTRHGPTSITVGAAVDHLDGYLYHKCGQALCRSKIQ